MKKLLLCLLISNSACGMWNEVRTRLGSVRHTALQAAKITGMGTLGFAGGFLKDPHTTIDPISGVLLGSVAAWHIGGTLTPKFPLQKRVLSAVQLTALVGGYSIGRYIRSEAEKRW